MKNKKNISKSLNIKEGFFVDKKYENFETMSNTAENYKFHCTYQLLPHAISGHYQILHLNSIELTYSKRSGGMMQNIDLAADSIVIALIENCSGKACYYRSKLKTGDILFLDSQLCSNLITNDTIELRILTINRAKALAVLPILSQLTNHSIKDIDNLFLTTLQDVWKQFSENSKNSKMDFIDLENKIWEAIKTLLNTQTPIKPTLTTGEEIALTIREQLYNHMDLKITIHSLAKQYNISEQTLQNAFKSLFGFTPKIFIRQLKLNLVHHNLKYAHSNENVSTIAQKWGFSHMGRFSNYYKTLFGVYPVQTLKKSFLEEKLFSDDCVTTQDEI